MLFLKNVSQQVNFVRRKVEAHSRFEPAIVGLASFISSDWAISDDTDSEFNFYLYWTVRKAGYLPAVFPVTASCMYHYLKLTCHHLNRRHICFNIKSIPVHPLLWMNFMLDFICMVFAEMWTTFRMRNLQNDNFCLCRESNQRPFSFQRAPLTTRLSGLLATWF